jgi:hypothetical protein
MLPTTVVTFSMDLQEWDIVFRALGEQPYRIVNPIIRKLSVQLEKSQEPPLPSASEKDISETFQTLKPPSPNGPVLPMRSASTVTG